MNKIIVILFSVSLTACATHQQFDCPYKEGARCLSVGEIDKKIDAGEIGHDKTTNNQKSICKTSLFSACKKASFDENSSSPYPLRTQESVLTLWIAPFYSIDGTYHESQRLHFVAKEASWKDVNPEIVEDTL